VSTSRIDIRIDDAKVLEAFSKAPEVMRRHVGDGVRTGAGEITSEAQRLAPKSETILRNSINFKQTGALEWVVHPEAGYAAAVEQGSGPAAGRPKYYPNRDNLLAYLTENVKARGFSRWKRSERGRLEQEMSLKRRAQAFAWWIYQHGTKAQPFMAPAAEAKRDRCTELVRAAVSKGLLEVFGGHA
jgi:HK97 gp10 family phage protein